MAGTTALLRGAASIRDQLATYQDSLKAYEYSNSAYTDSALSQYSAYLKTRIDGLNKSGSISDASKALSLTKSLDSATKSNISATIQRENIQMLAGNATLTDKYNVIAQQFVRAQANGDMTLAQSLMGQAYSVSQSIQLQAQQAADASAALARSHAAASTAAAKFKAQAEGNIADHIGDSLKQLNNDIKIRGTKDFNKVVKDWVNANSKTLESLGVKLPNQPNYWDIVTGVAGAQYNHDMLAAKMYAPYGTGIGSTSWNYAQKAYNVNAGISTLPTLAGGMTLQQIQQASTNNDQFVYNPAKGKFVQTQQTGNAFQKDANGHLALQPTFSGTVDKTIVITPTQTATMAALGLEFGKNKNGTTGNGVQIQSTGQSPAWIKNVLGNNGVTNLFSTPEGLQFTYSSKSGSGLSTYTVIRDANGKLGLAEESDMGSKILNGQYGFDATSVGHQSQDQSWFGRIGHAISTATHGIADTIGHGLMGTASADTLLGTATGNYKLPPLPVAPPMQLPALHVAPPVLAPKAAAPLRVAAPAIPTFKSVAQPTVNPQKTAPAHTLQGGGISLQGGGGIRLQ